MAVKIRGIKPSDKQRILEIVKDTKAFVAEEVTVAEEVIDDYFNDPKAPATFST
ncbi:MAG: hypothetical protein NTZ34_14145 [Chloroflexi bacterium]|nr:hypothetical protein [Chloroflexota bacterium]